MQYELRLTEFFSERGYNYSLYVPYEDYRATDSRNNYYYLANDPMRMILKNRCPIIKKESFRVTNIETASMFGNERKNEMMKKLSELGYPADLIYDNILRTLNISQIYSSLHLNYILPEDVCVSNPNRAKVLVAAHLHYDYLVDEALEYLLPINEIFDVVVTTSVESIKERVSTTGINVIPVPARGRDISALLVTIKELSLKYDYLCFTHDKTDYVKGYTVGIGASFRYLLWENTLASDEYASNVIKLFEANPRLGFLGVPTPYHSIFFTKLRNFWHSEYIINFQDIKNLAERLGITVPLSIDFPPISVGSAFWCRVDALKDLFEYNWEIEDFPPEPMPRDNTISPAIERIFPFAAQNRGYLSGIVMSRRYAEVRLTDMEDVLGALVKQLSSSNRFSSVKDCLYDLMDSDVSLIDFAKSHESIYIYGAGAYGHIAMNVLINHGIPFKGFIVTDGQYKPSDVSGYPATYLSEVKFTSDSGVIIALQSVTAQRQVVENLIEKSNVIEYYAMV